MFCISIGIVCIFVAFLCGIFLPQIQAGKSISERTRVMSSGM